MGGKHRGRSYIRIGQELALLVLGEAVEASFRVEPGLFSRVISSLPTGDSPSAGEDAVVLGLVKGVGGITGVGSI